MTAPDALTDPWDRWRAFAGAADAPAVHARLARFHPARSAEPGQVRLAADLLARGVALLQAALGWDRPAAGPRRPADTRAARGEQWRLVMGYAGFELLARALLDPAPGVGLGPDDFTALLGCCALPGYEPLALDPAAQPLADWPERRAPVADWHSALCLARALRDATVHGGMPAAAVQRCQLRPVLDRLLADLARVAAATVAVLTEEKRPAQPGRPAGRAAFRRPAPERVPGAGPGSEEEALVRAIAADPEDDGPRLVYADWLEEHGQPDRATFIRLQCEFARVAAAEREWGAFERSDRWEALNSRCEAATPRAEGVWAVPESVAVEFHRGLPAVVTCGPREFVDHGRDWLAAAPTLHGLRLTDVGRSARGVRALADAEHLAGFTRLWVGRAAGAALEALLASRHLAGLTDLDLFGVGLRNTGALAGAHHLTRLTRLELLDCRLGDARLAELVRSPVVGRLAYLGLSNNSLHPAGARALAGCHRLTSLATLDLQHNPLGTAGAQAIFASPHLGSLRRLNLSGTDLGPAAARALARQTGLAGLESLDLSGNRLGDSGVAALAASDRLAGLERLDLGYNGLTARGVEALAGSPALAGLRELALSDDGIGDAGLQALARSPHLSGLRELAIQTKATAGLRAAGPSRLGRLERLSVRVDQAPAALAACELFGLPANLDLQGNSLADGPVAALAAMPGLANVARLDLSFNGIGDRGAWALAESPHLGNLEELNLHCNRVGPAGAEALVAGLPRLTRLVLGSNSVRGEGVKRLAATPSAGRLTSLGLWFNKMDEGGVRALAGSPHLANLRHLDLRGNDLSRAAVLSLLRSANLPRLGLLRVGLDLPAGQVEELRAEAARRGITLAG